jgi:hypothetical protein
VALISLVVQDGPILRIVEQIHNKQNDAGALEESNLLAKTSSSKIATLFLMNRQNKVISRVSDPDPYPDRSALI